MLNKPIIISLLEVCVLNCNDGDGEDDDDDDDDDDNDDDDDDNDDDGDDDGDNGERVKCIHIHCVLYVMQLTNDKSAITINPSLRKSMLAITIMIMMMKMMMMIMVGRRSITVST